MGIEGYKTFMHCAISMRRGASIAAAAGGLELPIKVVQNRLGHAGIQMTADRYGHLFPRNDHSAELAAAERAFLGA